MIYIATNIHGQGVRLITAFDDRRDFLNYADEVLSCNDKGQMIRAKSTPINRICEALYDSGMGTGARSHRRVTRDEAIDHIKNGFAKPIGCYNLRIA